MARRESNTLAVIIWFLGLLGCAGYIDFFYPVGYFPVLVPILFLILGSRFTKAHSRAYLNVLITAFLIHVVGAVIDLIFNLLTIHIFQFIYLALIYFAIHCIMGLLSALNNHRFKPELVVKVLK